MHPSRHRTPLGRALPAALLCLLAGWACGDSTSEPKPTPTPTTPANPAVNLVLVTSPKTTGAPWEVAGIFSVRAEDAAGHGVPGVHVRFASRSGKGGTEFGPTDTTTTDSTGIAWAGVKLGTKAGPDEVWATTSSAGTVFVSLVITPGTPKYLRIDQYDFQLYQSGDSASFQAHVVDGWENGIPDAPFNFV